VKKKIISYLTEFVGIVCFSYKQLYECRTFFIIIFNSVLRFKYIAFKIGNVCLVQKVVCTSYLNVFVYVLNSVLVSIITMYFEQLSILIMFVCTLYL